MLLGTIFTVHAASACEVVPPTPLVVHEASKNETTTVDAVVYEIRLAEVKRDVSDRSLMRVAPSRARLIRRAITPPSPPLRDTLFRSFIALENEGITGFYIEASNDAVLSLVKALISSNSLSIWTSPSVRTIIGTEAAISVGTETQLHEIKVLPVSHDNGKILTNFVVKQTEIHKGEEKTHLLEHLQFNLPTDSQSSVVMGGKLGDKEVILVVRAWKVQDAEPVEVARNMRDPEWIY
jgi:hypothetical protein